MTLNFRHACLVLVALLLAGCLGADNDQIRLCRMVPAGLHTGTGEIVITRAVTGPKPYSVAVQYTRKPDEPGQSNHQILCEFGGGRFSRERQDLVGFVADGDRFGEARLLYLNRFWLGEPEAARMAPRLSHEELGPVLQVSLDQAIALQHILAALPRIAIYVLLAPAYALIYGLIGRINLAFGELAILGGQGALIGAIGGFMLMPEAPSIWMLLCAMVLALAVAATHGDLMARFVFVPLMNRSGQAVLVASVGLAIAAMEYVRLAQGSGTRWTPPLLNTPVTLARNNDFLVTTTEGSFAAVVLCVSVVTALIFLMKVSRFGRAWRAVSDDPKAASLFGIDVGRVLTRSFAFASLLAGLAGFIMSAHYGGIGFSGGLAIGLKALVGAIAGGIGSVGGAILGALLIGVFEAIWSSFFPLEQADIAVYSLLVVLLIFRPGGLFGFGDTFPRRI
jgi:branched-chain amino acid transport system permease protein